MYSKKAWGGNVDPEITVRFEPSTNAGDQVSLVIFEFEDEPFLGRIITVDNSVEV